MACFEIYGRLPLTILLDLNIALLSFVIVFWIAMFVIVNFVKTNINM